MVTVEGETVFGRRRQEKSVFPAESASHEKYKSWPVAGLTFYIPAQGSTTTTTAPPTFLQTAEIL